MVASIISRNWVVVSGLLRSGGSCVASVLSVEEVWRQETRGIKAGACLLTCTPMYTPEKSTRPAARIAGVDSCAADLLQLWAPQGATTVSVHFLTNGQVPVARVQENSNITNHRGRFCHRLSGELTALQFEMVVQTCGCRKLVEIPLRVWGCSFHWRSTHTLCLCPMSILLSFLVK